MFGDPTSPERGPSGDFSPNGSASSSGGSKSRGKLSPGKRSRSVGTPKRSKSPAAEPMPSMGYSPRRDLQPHELLHPRYSDPSQQRPFYSPLDNTVDSAATLPRVTAADLADMLEELQEHCWRITRERDDCVDVAKSWIDAFNQLKQKDDELFKAYEAWKNKAEELQDRYEAATAELAGARVAQEVARAKNEERVVQVELKLSATLQRLEMERQEKQETMAQNQELQAQLADLERRLRWYESRKTSANFSFAGSNVAA
ncbi:hypothetical protein M427DRAFT_133219 [Gonapodya prolifera JEL478]|uniref:Uncharacterized protein n=1 Tax=Gonapodya prolifera (strain JEL478) TaxID=1344416 RepID=A0A139ALZ7_GONPJ|nr:hypothetical protein M427DRAFT_133219 [Gonapodya prolifera JEL478]|eukprot:KXS17718.1 hypothetical protein M427DRAFT_133219 [Gonapodya prolifera JEL478]